MGKIFSRKVISTAVAGSLLFGAGSAVVTATPKAESKQTELTVQNVQTGVITINEVTVPSNAREVQLSGTVVIDGPQLVVSIPGAKKITVTNVSDKVWTFEAVVDVSSIKADAVFEIAAYTVFTNGRNVGKIHTMAPTVSQKIHVRLSNPRLRKISNGNITSQTINSNCRTIKLRIGQLGKLLLHSTIASRQRKI